MQGMRKIFLGFTYLFCASGLAWKAIDSATSISMAPDYTGLGIMLTGLATGIGAVVWGNVQTHKTKNGQAHS